MVGNGSLVLRCTLVALIPRQHWLRSPPSSPWPLTLGLGRLLYHPSTLRPQLVEQDLRRAFRVVLDLDSIHVFDGTCTSEDGLTMPN